MEANKKRRGPKYSPFSKEFYMHYRNMSEQDALFEAKSKRPTNIEYWIKKGYSQEEASKKMFEHQTSTANKYAQKRKENPEKYSDVQTNQLGYWIKKGLSIEEAKIEHSKRQQTFSKEKCVEKYGEEVGIQKWQERQDKWQKTLCSKSQEDIDDINKRKAITLERLIEKYGEKEGTEKYSLWYTSIVEGSKKRLLERGSYWLNASKSSLKIFLPFYDYIKAHNIDDNDIYFGYENHKEFWIRTKKYFFSYDFAIKSRRFLVEYNGICFHPRKDKLTEAEFCNWKQLFSNTSAHDIYEKDQLKLQIARNAGYNIITLWEDDDTEKNISLLIEEFIKNESRYKSS